MITSLLSKKSLVLSLRIFYSVLEKKGLLLRSIRSKKLTMMTQIRKKK